jgi:hypothetical protein
MKRRQERFDKMATKKPSSQSTFPEVPDAREPDQVDRRLVNDYPLRPFRPDPPATNTLNGNDWPGNVEKTAANGSEPVSPRLQRLADISAARPASYRMHCGMPGVFPNPSYAGYLKQLISMREYSRLSLLSSQRPNMMAGAYATASFQGAVDRVAGTDFRHYR